MQCNGYTFIPSFCPLHLVSLSSAIAMAVILKEFDIEENYDLESKGITSVDVNSKSELEIKLIGMKDDSTSASQFQSLKLEAPKNTPTQESSSPSVSARWMERWRRY